MIIFLKYQIFRVNFLNYNAETQNTYFIYRGLQVKTVKILYTTKMVLYKSQVL